jgi:hypothetical protein
MTNKRIYSIPELLDLADRMIGYSVSGELNDEQATIKKDCHSCGSILAYLIIENVLTGTLTLPGMGEIAQSQVQQRQQG